MAKVNTQQSRYRMIFQRWITPLPPIGSKHYHSSVIAVKSSIAEGVFLACSDDGLWFWYRISCNTNTYRAMMSLRAVSPPQYASLRGRPFFFLFVVCFIINVIVIKKAPINWRLVTTIGQRIAIGCLPPQYVSLRGRPSTLRYGAGLICLATGQSRF